MKRLTIILFFALLLVSCQKDVVVESAQEAVMTYTLSPDVQFVVKSSSAAEEAGKGSQINVLWYGVYHKKADGEYVYMSDMSAFVEVKNVADIKVPISLILGQEYRIVFVAQHRLKPAGGDHIYMYNVDEETGTLTRNTSDKAEITLGEQLDVFVYADELGPITGNESRKITLHRPVAMMNIATSLTPLPTAVDITLSEVSASYNIFESEFSTETTSLEFEGIIPTGQTVTVGGTAYLGLTTLYVLGGHNVDMQIAHSGNTKTINNIAIAENYKTNIVGNI